MFRLLYSLYANLTLSMRDASLPEKVLRMVARIADKVESALLFQGEKLGSSLRKGPGAKAAQDTLLAVYSLKSNGLTFDFVTFIGIVEMERIRRKLRKSKVIVYAPEGFPIYQWQKRKVFYNMGGKPLLTARRDQVIEYVERLAGVSRILSKTVDYEVIGERRKFYKRVLEHGNVFPACSPWTGEFPGMTEYRTYSKLKYEVNGGADAVTGFPKHRLGELWSGRDGKKKIVATINFRNQTYTTGRNASMKEWEEFLFHPFIIENFHFIIFNDAENPVQLKETGGFTFYDRYVQDNFRRFKTILSVGLHVGNVSGSSSIVIISDVPYLLLGAQGWDSWKECLNPQRFSKEGDVLKYDKGKGYQLISFRQDDIMGEVRNWLGNLSGSSEVLGRYPDYFKERLNEVLKDWP